MALEELALGCQVSGGNHGHYFAQGRCVIFRLGNAFLALESQFPQITPKLRQGLLHQESCHVPGTKGHEFASAHAGKQIVIFVVEFRRVGSFGCLAQHLPCGAQQVS